LEYLLNYKISKAIQVFQIVDAIAGNGHGFVQAGKKVFLLPRTVAKYIIKSSFLLLSLNNDSSARDYC